MESARTAESAVMTKWRNWTWHAWEQGCCLVEQMISWKHLGSVCVGVGVGSKVSR